MARNPFQIQLNHRELDHILKEGVMEALRDIAHDVEIATGMPADEYEVEEWVGVNRARVSIKTASWPAAAREARDHNLVRALGGGVPNPSALISYTSRSGRTSMRTQAEIDNYTRNRSGG